MTDTTNIDNGSKPPRRRAVDSGGFWWGIGLVALGALLMVDHFDLANVSPLFRYWPLVLVVIGGTLFVTAKENDGQRTGAWLTVVGSWMLISQLGWFGFHWGDSWPLLVMGAGLIQLAIPKPEERRTGGLTTLMIGAWLLISVHGYWGLTWSNSWPLVLIAIGVGMFGKAVVEQWNATEGRDR